MDCSENPPYTCAEQLGRFCHRAALRSQLLRSLTTVPQMQSHSKDKSPADKSLAAAMSQVDLSSPKETRASLLRRSMVLPLYSRITPPQRVSLCSSPCSCSGNA